MLTFFLIFYFTSYEIETYIYQTNDIRQDKISESNCFTLTIYANITHWAASKCTAATSTAAAAAAASNGGLDQGNRGEQSKAILIRNGPALSLGGRTQHQHRHQGLYSNSYNTSTAATASFYNHHHQSLQFGSASSNDASLQSTGNGGAGSGPDQHQQNQTNLLRLGQAMFQVDFMWCDQNQTQKKKLYCFFVWERSCSSLCGAHFPSKMETLAFFL